MSINALTQRLAELSKELATLDPDSDEYLDLESKIFDLEEDIEDAANSHTKQDFH